jgi:hypothetical protein
MCSHLISTSAAGLLIAFASSALAVPTVILHTDTPECDPLSIPELVDELGFSPPFPLDERLDAVATFTQIPACPLMDDPAMPNALVMITNLAVPPRAFDRVWYVADRETSLTNPDGVAGMPGIPPERAFRIDTVGVNTPLVSESFAMDGVWAPGETWTFIIQDYANTLGLPPSLYDSIGVPSTLSPPSSGSIIAVPEPSFAAMGLLGAILTRRRSRSIA